MAWWRFKVLEEILIRNVLLFFEKHNTNSGMLYAYNTNQQYDFDNNANVYSSSGL
jgi:hypothetical protein